MECKYIKRDFMPDPAFNQPQEFECDNGFKYVFYQHNDGFGKVYPCQFCRLIGRKRDVFECLNEPEWKACSHYLSAERIRHDKKV